MPCYVHYISAWFFKKELIAKKNKGFLGPQNYG